MSLPGGRALSFLSGNSLGMGVPQGYSSVDGQLTAASKAGRVSLHHS